MKRIKCQKGKLLTAIAVWLTIILCGCNSQDEVIEQKFPEELEHVESQTLASNDQYSLEWDSKKVCILLKQKATGKVWSTIPYDFYQGTETNEALNSPISIEFVNSTSLIRERKEGFSGSVAENRVSSHKLEDGIELVYYFDSVGISVPVQYRLREEALAVTVDFTNVKEGKNRLLAVSVAPFLCSTRNTTEGAYLVVPSGSGGLMYVDEREEGIRTWSGEIYGKDPSRLVPEEVTEDETVRLPIFGVKSNDEALLAIVEEGEEAAYITANAGDGDIGYSNVYVSFYARGFDISESSEGNRTITDIYQTTEELSAGKTTVAFYPMHGEGADYVAMAEKYRTYLQEKGFMQDKAEEKAYALYITGGAGLKELFLGIPVKKMKALTTFEEAELMLQELVKETKTAPEVQLRGFGGSGLDAEKIAGGFEFSEVFGDDKQRLSLEAYCAANRIPLYTDFDLIHFTSNGEGYFTLSDAAGSALMRKVKLYEKDKALWNYDKEAGATLLLKRSELGSVIDKLEKMIQEKDISAVSLSTLSNMAYSDYSQEQYHLRGNSIADFWSYIAKLQKSETRVATQSANAYAAAVSDSVFDVPTGNGNYHSLDAAIPLYQMIFKGYVPLYSTSLNTEADLEKAVMLAVQSGTSLGFSLVKEYDARFATTSYLNLNESSYEGNKSRLVEVLAGCSDYYSLIQGETIVGYEFLSEYVTKTSFSNGVVVYANHGDETVTTPAGELQAYGFAYVSGGM